MSRIPFAHNSFISASLLFQTKTFLIIQSHQNWVLSRCSRSLTSVSNHATFPAFLLIPTSFTHFVAASKHQLTMHWRAPFRLSLEIALLFKNLICVSNGYWYCCASILFAVLVLIFNHLYLLFNSVQRIARQRPFRAGPSWKSDTSRYELQQSGRTDSD